MTFTIALMIAVSYWGARDVKTPCHPVGVRINYEQMNAIDQAGQDVPAGIQASMRADVRACSVLIGPFGDALRYTDDPRGWDYCRDVVHEVGHIDGLEHSYGGVMVPETGHVPWACTHERTFLRHWRAGQRG